MTAPRTASGRITIELLRLNYDRAISRHRVAELITA
jgi:hypothetical protein